MTAAESPRITLDDPRVTFGLRVDFARQVAARSGVAVLLGLVACALALATLGPRDWVAYGAWAGTLAVVIGWRAWLARGLMAAADDVCERRLPWLQAAVLLFAMAWGVLAWVGPPPRTGTETAALVMLQGAVAIGGSMLALSERRIAAAFALLVALPLAARLLTGTSPDPMLAALTGAILALLQLSLWFVGGRSERERRSALAARLGQSLQAERATTAGQLLAHVFEHVGEGICIFDAGLRLRAANVRVGELLGLESAHLTPGTPLATWLRHLAAAGHYGQVDADTEVARRLADVARPVPSVAQRQRPDGRTIETRRTPLPEGGFAMVCVDISERVASEAALFENRRTLEVLLQQTEEGFWFIDNQQRTTDANPAMCRMLGLARDDLLGRPIWDFVDAENREVFRAQVARRDQGKANTYEITLTRADGGLVTCVNNATPIHDAQGNKIGAIGLFSDVTAERQAAAAARAATAMVAEQSRVLAVTLDSLSQGVLGFDAGLRLRSWNRRAVELLELPEPMLAEHPTLFEIGRWQVEQGTFGADMRLIEGDACREAVRRHIADKASAGDEPVLYRRRRRDGRVIEVRTLLGRDGGQVRTYTDVTSEVQASEAMVAARDEAERANRAKSDFLSRMSHELRTPLNAILGFGQLMRTDAAEPLGRAQRQRLQQILGGGEHLLTLINEVLDLARVETGTLPLHITTVDADAMVDECLRLVAPVAAQRPVRLLPRQGTGGGVRADATRLRQVLLNLLANAIKYNKVGGEVRLQCCVHEDRVRIDVLDTGPGLDASQQQRLFQPFERLDADRDAIEGTGIGLALSRMLVEAMAGDIGVQSLPGEGCCFWVTLPRDAAAVSTVAPPVVMPAAASSDETRRRVLYVEDNPVNQLVMQGMLAHRPSVDLVLASAADEGLAAAQARRPDLVLMDIQLPGASGYEALAALKEDPGLRSVPVVAVSANAMPADTQRARAAGFSDYLTKPLDLQTLLAAVDRWLAVTAD